MAAALLLCAFPKLTGSEEKPNPPPANIEDQIRLLNDQLNSIDRRLTEIELGLMVTGNFLSPEAVRTVLAAKRPMALSQCKIDWMNHPAAREEKSSGALTSGDYLAACMESHGFRRRVACLATPDSETCYDPTDAAIQDAMAHFARRSRTAGAVINVYMREPKSQEKALESLDSSDEVGYSYSEPCCRHPHIPICRCR
jgi:hypothetical protein